MKQNKQCSIQKFSTHSATASLTVVTVTVSVLVLFVGEIDGVDLAVLLSSLNIKMGVMSIK